MSEEDVELGPFVAGLLSDLELVDGRVVARPEVQTRWADALDEVPKPDRQRVCEELLAAAIRFREMGGDAAQQAVDLLMALAASLVARDTALKATYDEAAARLAKETALGTKEDLRPTTDRPTEDGAVKWSPLQRFGLGKKLDGD